MSRSGAGPDSPRAVALAALVRIDRDGAYANLELREALERSGLDERDRGLVTELVYGTTRMRRACDWLVDRFVGRPPDLETRNALRLGAYQLVYLRTAPHAAVDATVAATPRRTRGFVNAVLRRVAEAGVPDTWPDLGTELSYPDWVIDRLVHDLGVQQALATLRAMNERPTVTERTDGYVQDEASQWVAAAAGATPGESVLDLCAAPGGKATALAATGAMVTAVDIRPARAGLVVGNARRTSTRVDVVVADGRRPPFRPAAFDRVLVDAPCSGLGVLHRRADARWRGGPDEVDRLAVLQVELLEAARDLVTPGGVLVFSVCTLTAAETTGVAEAVGGWADWEAEPPGAPWRAVGHGGRLLPQDHGTDGMYVLRLRRDG